MPRRDHALPVHPPVDVAREAIVAPACLLITPVAEYEYGRSKCDVIGAALNASSISSTGSSQTAFATSGRVHSLSAACSCAAAEAANTPVSASPHASPLHFPRIVVSLCRSTCVSTSTVLRWLDDGCTRILPGS